MSPVDRDLGGPVSQKKKRPKTLGTSSGAKFEKQSKHGETQSYNFRAYHTFGNSNSCITAVKWDAYDVENTAGNVKRCLSDFRIHLAFMPETGLKCFPARLPRSRLEKPKSREPSQPASPMNTSKFYKGFSGKARSRKPG